MRPDTCIHFNGILNECCDQKVNYSELSGGERFGMWMKIPCLPSKTPAAQPVTCPKHQLPSAEEIAAHRAHQAEQVAKHLKVMPVVNAWRKQGKQGKQAVITCPACGGKLQLYQSARNGHVHGSCETDGCVQWVE